MRCIRSGISARAVSGQVVAAPPSSVMNSRRFMSALRVRRRHRTRSNDCFDWGWEPLRDCNMRCGPNDATGHSRRFWSIRATSAFPLIVPFSGRVGMSEKCQGQTSHS